MNYTISFTDTTKSPFVIKPYTANGPTNPGAPTPLYSTAVSANTSLTLLGKGTFDYGEPIQKNLVHMLENFANKTRPVFPVQGQLWYKNKNAGDPSWPGDPSTIGLYVYTGNTWQQLLIAGVAMGTYVDAGNNKIVNVGDAQNPQDVLNMRTGDDRYVNVAGDQMGGVLSMSSYRITNVGEAVEAFDALSLSSGDSRYLRLTGGQMLGSLDINNNYVTNLADAVNPQDALNLRTANKLFVSVGGNTVDGGTF